ncbi:helix-turn-helix domain-containing protein [Myxococcus sp. AB025B]|uniref:helix-turn-helix domain-containing protein n=1 Tax=Myxococcus TaxID=32 RepID=UPI001E448179|nr:helix-turn-helix domain-containing protein [Myxococcus sp. AB025B]
MEWHLRGCEREPLSRAFKASTGVAPYQWQLQARLARAQEMMMATSASLERIAEATGFADGVHFGKAFRRVHGTTPAAWRRERGH